MKIYIGADHRGFDLKAQLKSFLLGNSEEVEDLGANEFVDNDDFVEYAADVASRTLEDPGSRGILICGSGAGVEIAANKIKGARCSLGQSIDQVKKARQADNINILAIASDFTDFNKAKDTVQAFLTTDFVSNENHERRLEKIKNLE